MITIIMDTQKRLSATLRVNYSYLYRTRNERDKHSNRVSLRRKRRNTVTSKFGRPLHARRVRSNNTKYVDRRPELRTVVLWVAGPGVSLGVCVCLLVFTRGCRSRGLRRRPAGAARTCRAPANRSSPAPRPPSPAARTLSCVRHQFH